MTKPTRILPIACALGLLAACLWAGSSSAANLPAGFQEQTVFQGLEEPTNFRTAPDGRTFVALKGGEIVVFPAGSGSNAAPLLFADLRRQVYDRDDRGILGLALDPLFDQGRPFVYVLYSYDHVLGAPGESPRYGQPPSYKGDPCPDPQGVCVNSGRLVRLTAQGDHAAPFAGQPSQEVLIEDWCQQFPSHSIGDLQFGPEGALFVSGGDGASYDNIDFGQFGNPCGDPPGSAGQSLSSPNAEGGALRSQGVLGPTGRVSLDGSLLRVDPDTGLGWPGNPFAGSPSQNARRILAFGLRNPFRFTLDPESGAAFVDNVGWNDLEEIDRIPIASAHPYNSGWPCFEGDAPIPQYRDAGLSACDRLYSQPGSTQAPLFDYRHSEPVTSGDNCPSGNGSAISGLAIYEGSSYPEKYHRALFFSDSVRGCFYAMLADAAGEPDPTQVEPFLTNAYGYPGVDIEQGPGGDLLYSDLGDGTIKRIYYDAGSPHAVLTADREWGDLPLTINFSASGSSAAEAGHPLSYAWDLNGDGQFGDAPGLATASRTYGASQNVSVAVRVTDQVTGKSAEARLTVYPGDTPPNVQITEPLASRTWAVGEPLNFSGSAAAKSGDANLYWRTRLLHCPFNPNECHEHPLQVFSGVNSGSLLAPNHDFPSYINFILTATDSRGLSGEASVKIAARPATLQLRSSPPGIALTAGLRNAATPFDLQVIEGSPTTIAAPASAAVSGVTYAFSGWSDGGARIHVVPGAAGTYTASYVPTTAATSAQKRSGSSLALRRRLEPRIRKRPHKVTRQRTARFVFTSAADRFQCRLDRGHFSSCHSPRLYRHLGRGAHTFRVRPVARNGSPLTKATAFRWKIIGR